MLSINLARISNEILLFNYVPIIENGEANGLILFAEKLDLPLYLYNIAELVSGHINKFQKKSNDEMLSARELEIIYLLFHFTYEEMAFIINAVYGSSLKPVTISKIISRNLYTKFNVLNLKSLKEIAFQKGYHKKIPLSLLGNIFIPITKI